LTYGVYAVAVVTRDHANAQSTDIKLTINKAGFINKVDWYGSDNLMTAINDCNCLAYKYYNGFVYRHLWYVISDQNIFKKIVPILFT
jgi:hypothetical protein